MDKLYYEIYTMLDTFFMSDEWNKLNTYQKLDFMTIMNKLKAKLKDDQYFEDMRKKHLG